MMIGMYKRAGSDTSSRRIEDEVVHKLFCCTLRVSLKQHFNVNTKMRGKYLHKVGSAKILLSYNDYTFDLFGEN